MEVPGVMLIRSVAFCLQISPSVSTDGPFSLCPPLINKCHPSPSGERKKLQLQRPNQENQKRKMTLGSDHKESFFTVSIQLLSYKESFIYFLIIPLLPLETHGWMVEGNEKGGV